MSTLDDFSIKEVIDYFGVDALLYEMGYDEELCFQTDQDLINYVIENASYIGVPLEPHFKYHIDKERYDTFVDLLERDKFGFELEEFLSKYD